MKRCYQCDGRFGLIRYRLALNQFCSRRCLNKYKADLSVQYFASKSAQVFLLENCEGDTRMKNEGRFSVLMLGTGRCLSRASLWRDCWQSLSNQYLPQLVVPKTPFIVPYRIRKSILEVLGVYLTRKRHSFHARTQHESCKAVSSAMAGNPAAWYTFPVR
jgi:hypothetical protein